MNWISMMQSTVSTVVSFLIWSLIVYLFYLARNKSLEYKLKRLIQPERSDPEENRVHVICANGTDVRVRIRDVRLITADDTHLSLSYLGDTGDVIRPRRPNDIIARRRNRAVTHNEKAGLIERNFVELPAETAGLWALTTSQVEDSRWRFVDCLLVIDYPTLLNTRKLMVVHAAPEIVEDLNTDFRRYLAARRAARESQPDY